jgi:hypothetical protein
MHRLPYGRGSERKECYRTATVRESVPFSNNVQAKGQSSLLLIADGRPPDAGR